MGRRVCIDAEDVIEFRYAVNNVTILISYCPKNLCVYLFNAQNPNSRSHQIRPRVLATLTPLQGIPGNFISEMHLDLLLVCACQDLWNHVGYQVWWIDRSGAGELASGVWGPISAHGASGSRCHSTKGSFTICSGETENFIICSINPPSKSRHCRTWPR